MTLEKKPVEHLQKASEKALLNLLQRKLLMGVCKTCADWHHLGKAGGKQYAYWCSIRLAAVPATSFYFCGVNNLTGEIIA